ADAGQNGNGDLRLCIHKSLPFWLPILCCTVGGDRALPAGGRAADGRRGWRRRKNHRSAGRRALPLLRGHWQLRRSAADHVPPVVPAPPPPPSGLRAAWRGQRCPQLSEVSAKMSRAHVSVSSRMSALRGEADLA